jgi:hypothetical protein
MECTFKDYRMCEVFKVKGSFGFAGIGLEGKLGPLQTEVHIGPNVEVASEFGVMPTGVTSDLEASASFDFKATARVGSHGATGKLGCDLTSGSDCSKSLKAGKLKGTPRTSNTSVRVGSNFGFGKLSMEVDIWAGIKVVGGATFDFFNGLAGLAKEVVDRMGGNPEQQIVDPHY